MIRRDDFQTLYFNRGLVPDHAAIFARWTAASEALRRTHGGMITLDAGPKPRQRVDVFPAGPADAPVHLFVHGGYWQAMDRTMHHFIAEGLIAHGITAAFSGYTLAPDASISDILAETGAAVTALCRHVGRPIVISGHSAGGHIASAMLASDWGVATAELGFAPIAGALPISGVFELEPLLHTSMNQALKLDLGSARRLSTRLWEPPVGARAVIAVGGAESAEFLRQTRGLAVSWMAAGVDCAELIVPDTNHFTVLDDFARPDGLLTRVAVALATGAPL